MINLQPFAMRPGLMTDNTHGASALLASLSEEAVYPFTENTHSFSEKYAYFSQKRPPKFPKDRLAIRTTSTSGKPARRISLFLAYKSCHLS